MPGSIILAWPHAADFNAQMRIMTGTSIPPCRQKDQGHGTSSRRWANLAITVDNNHRFVRCGLVEHLSAELFRFCFCPGLSILSLDDDKLRKLSRLFSILGFKRTFTRASGACPVMHMLVDLILGITLVGRLDRPGAFLPSTVLNLSSFLFLL